MKRIVVVEDDPSIQEAIRLLFDPGSFELIVYADASPLFNDTFTLPDLFILDKQLSGIDGLDLCRMLKQRDDTRHIPIIILSASPHIRRLAASAGADDVLEKPFRIQVLRECVDRQLNKVSD